MKLFLGIDVGSIAVKAAVIDESLRILEARYAWCHGRPFERLEEVLASVLGRHRAEDFSLAAFTGTGGALAARALGGVFVNEVIAQSESVIRLYPRARSIIEMGGEDSKLIMLSDGGAGPAVRLKDFAMNGLCAAGTGSFLDQQAARMGISIEKDFGALALQSTRPPRIAGRCSVFAKSDMIHLQQIATPVADIVAGLCAAVARNFKSNLARGRTLERPVVFQGGVAANAGMVRAFRELLDLGEGELIVPEHHAAMGAIGAVFHLLGSPPRAAEGPFLDPSRIGRLATRDHAPGDSLPPLRDTGALLVKEADVRLAPGVRLPVFLGLDIGSLSTNVVLIDGENRVIARRYLPTASRPLEAIQRGLNEISDEVGDRVEVRAVGSTGSGRYLTGDFVGADVVQNEITAQSTAAIAIDPTVDTIFEIGGQDSKFISIDGGVVVDFEMNKVCAAGTGSFLEEQAEKLGISIVDQFSGLAFASPRPARLGDRCTVFMDSDLNARQQKGAGTEDLVGGLAYSIVYNYLQKVVGTKRVGARIFFQGGVANNRSVISAFAAVTGKPITVPPHFDVTGAIGAAMIARERMRETEADGRQWRSRFKGFGVGRAAYALDRFPCGTCANQCEIRRVRVEGEARPLYYGGRCEKWEQDGRTRRASGLPNLVEERLALLLGDYREESGPAGAPTIGIPRCLTLFYQQFPFWRAFFEELGFRVVLSRPTDRRLIQRSLEMLTTETCIPVEVAYGHVMDLLDRGVDRVFLPFQVSAKPEEDNPTANYNCPWVQTHPFMIKAALRDTTAADRLLIPALHFRYFSRVLPDDLAGFMGDAFGTPPQRVRRALASADEAQVSFENAVRERGRRLLSDLPACAAAAVILARPYNTADPSLNLGLVEKLLGLDVLPIPVDYLPLARERILEDYYMMCWPNGQKILAGARIVAGDERLQAVHLGNFRCGPDSFLSHYLREELAGKPYLQLEVDEHSADAGMITRIEAFLDSLKARRAARMRAGAAAAAKPHQEAAPAVASAPGTADGPHREAAPAPGTAPAAQRRIGERFRTRTALDAGRVLYYPYMSDGAYALAAASRGCGVETRVLPMQDAEDIALARQNTAGRECFPAICTLGNFLRKMKEPGFQPSRASFFMPDHGGPCRFGQYNKMQRLVFDRLGYGDVEIVAPSNEDAYVGLSGGHGNRFRFAAVTGLMAFDLLRKLQQERRPYEAEPGAVNRAYGSSLERIVASIERGGRDIVRVMAGIAEEFRGIRTAATPRRPVIAVMGEIFMRDNPFCSGHLVERLESLGAETWIAPFVEWLTYSTIRWVRDSRWKGDVGGLLRASVQSFATDSISRILGAAVKGSVDSDREVGVRTMLDMCGPYVHRDYDGDPALALGGSAALAATGISGIAHIMPFTCLPGAAVAGVAGSFRKDHADIPWVDIDFDGQEDAGMATRLQAFMHQAGAHCARCGAGRPGG